MMTSSKIARIFKERRMRAWGKHWGTHPEKKKPYGYLVESGYYGWVDWYRGYMLFATEEEYLEYIDENR